MTRACLVIALCLLTTAHAVAQAPLRLVITGETNLRLHFAEQLRAAGLAFDLVSRGEQPGFTLVIAQESTLGTATAAVIVLDAAGDVATSVVRSGRFSGRGALNACAKEIAKRLTSLAK